MQVIGNNISNVNTVGFKKGSTTFADTLSQSVATQSGTAQVGRGMSLGSVDQNFSQGSFESTGNSTDLSIGGDGFFVLRQDGTENNKYTRAGNFHFDKDGKLVNPEGYLVQGWLLDEDTGDDVGSITDIILSAFSSPPKQSTEITMITNLDADSISMADVLSGVWDSSAEEFMNPVSYEYQSVVKAYDTLGSTHDITVYFDKKSDAEWEYVITCDPSEDQRNLVQGTTAQGLLARGTITFSQSSGDILDFTMSEFTGRISNVQADGINTESDVSFQVLNYEDMALDGYGFSFVFDGISWNFEDTNGDDIITEEDLPELYPNAVIVYSDDQTVNIAFDPEDPNDPDLEADLKIKLAQSAVQTDTFGFDVNNQNDIHVQTVEGTKFIGDTANENTTLQINDPDALTYDSDDISIVWNPTDAAWYWNNPAAAAEDGTSGTLVSGIDVSGISSTATTLNTYSFATDVTAMNMVSNDLRVKFDSAGPDWDWNMALKEEDIINEEFTFTPSKEPILTIEDNTGTQGAMASTAPVTLTWDGSAWSADDGGGNMDFTILTSGSDNTAVTLRIWEDTATSAEGSTIKYAFGSTLTTAADQTIVFEIDPAPPLEYPNALITAGSYDLEIDFDGDAAADITFDMVSSGAGAVGMGDVFVFDVDPDTPPPEYADATLKGDQDQAIIDLDGSGNDEDNDDIVFLFTDSLKVGPTAHPYADRSEISFDLKGSTSWTALSTDDINESGYFSFVADFLGGEFGETEQEIQFDIGTRFDGTNFVNDSLSSTQYARSSTTTFQDSDGYAAGDLQGVDVASDGIMTGIYSNGQLIPLYRVGLAKFLNNQGLSHEGGNLFAETRASGAAITNKPGENGLGTLSPNSLEMSNVDISEEFVKMITTQRGFEANSKIITTVDDMMNTVIQMKR